MGLGDLQVVFLRHADAITQPSGDDVQGEPLGEVGFGTCSKIL